MATFLKLVKILLLALFSATSWFPYFGLYTFKDICTIPLIQPFHLEKHNTAICIIIIILYMLVSFGEIIVEGNKGLKLTRNVHNILHKFRDELFKFKQQAEKIAFKDSTDYNIKKFYKAFSKYPLSICEELASLLKENYGKDYNVCIKLINASNNKIKTAKVYTLCRAGADKVERENEDNGEVKLINNTDFKQIVMGNKKKYNVSTFSVANLQALIFFSKVIKALKLDKEFSIYENTSENILKKYKSTVVVPIRLNRDFSKEHTSFQTNKFYIVGFLCVDCKEIQTSNTQKQINEITKGFGDLLYIYFNEIANSCKMKTNFSDKPIDFFE
ncbi:MAG: hypothetical protein IJ062_11855 [Firmicutes bacterium]|nr:hypothetical protein [Bacillota bacterium]